MKRVFLLILDSCGCGAAPDADLFGDAGSNTLRSMAGSGKLRIPNLIRMGIGRIPGVDYLEKAPEPLAAAGRMQERSMGKDTTIGHWEIAGICSDKPMPTYPDGFPADVMEAFEKAVGRKTLCNKPYSGTDAIRDFGREHLETGALIVYTSADSVFQIAAHEEKVPLEELYEICRRARKILQGENAVGRVIARPFTGTYPHFTRTANRRDFSLEPPGETMLDALKSAGKDVIAVGKIGDIFAGRGVTRSLLTHGNQEGMEQAEALAGEDFSGLCFVNLVDFDMLYGHRRDIDGYAQALSRFDCWLGDFLPKLRQEDVLMITADHGCDPGFVKTSDHTREFVPLLVYGKEIRPVDLGTRATFADVAASVCDFLQVPYVCGGNSFAREITADD